MARQGKGSRTARDIFDTRQLGYEVGVRTLSAPVSRLTL